MQCIYICGYIANLVTNISTVHMHGLTVIHEGAKQQAKRLTEWPGTSRKINIQNFSLSAVQFSCSNFCKYAS